ncbi:hypothetical protein D3C71_1538980 [compost metagenome]
MVVNPPLAAERLPVSTVSLCSNPGSRKCTCISMSPGMSSLPSASMISPASGAASFPSIKAEITPSSSTICFRSNKPSLFNTLAFLIITVMILPLPTDPGCGPSRYYIIKIHVCVYLLVLIHHHSFNFIVKLFRVPPSEPAPHKTFAGKSLIDCSLQLHHQSRHSG